MISSRILLEKLINQLANCGICVMYAKITRGMIIKEKKSLDSFGSFVKVVVDIERKILSAGCELHSDCVEELMANGSLYPNLWGANVYPKDKKIDFISLINIRPAENNRSMDIENPVIRKKVEDIIKNLAF